MYKRKGMKIERTDVEIINKEGKKLQCSHFQPLIKPCRQMPCVIYLHANASCRIEGYQFCHLVLALSTTLLAEKSLYLLSILQAVASRKVSIFLSGFMKEET